jgi:arylsulfatase A
LPHKPLCPPSASAHPTIVWILADDLGYADLGWYGQKTILTPNIDRMAAEGMRFTNTYSGCTVCAPSRNVLMTGFHAGHITVRSNPGGVSILPTDVTVAQVLKSAGYTTGGFIPTMLSLPRRGSLSVAATAGFDRRV